MSVDVYSYVIYGKIVEHDENSEQYMEDIYPDLHVHAIDDDNTQFLVGMEISDIEAYYSEEPKKLKFLSKAEELNVQFHLSDVDGSCAYHHWCEVSC